MVISYSFVFKAPAILIPEPALKSRVFCAPKSPRGVASFTDTSVLPKVASDKINEPSASHLSVAKLYTIECEPVTFEAALLCVPTPLKFLVSKPKPPVVGSVFEAPIRTNVSSISNVVVLIVVDVPFTSRLPVIVKLPPTVTLLGKPTVTVPAFSTTSTSPEVPANVRVPPKATGLVFEPSLTVILEFVNLLLPILPANLEAAIEPANMLFSTEPAAIVAVNVASVKLVNVVLPVKSPANVIVGSADNAKSKF